MLSLNVCDRCQDRLRTNSDANQAVASTTTTSSLLSEPEFSATFYRAETCVVCLGLHSESFARQLEAALFAAAVPYGGFTCNAISWNVAPPTVSLPGDILYRFQETQSKLTKNVQLLNKAESKIQAFDFAQYAKNTAKELVQKSILNLASTNGGDQTSSTSASVSMSSASVDTLLDVVKDEAQGHLCCHILVTPKKKVPRPTNYLPNQVKPQRTSRKRKFMDEPGQGGDPRMTLQRKVQNASPCIIWSLNQAQQDCHNTIETNQSVVTPYDPTKDYDSGNSSSISDLNLNNIVNNDNNEDNNDKKTNSSYTDAPVVLESLLDVHVAVWRRSFYLHSCYTKSRRDVSQTPFYAKDETTGKRVRLGVTSVEEQITPHIAKHCGGLSTQNEDALAINTVYGRVKFHASGREDMDVRMLLPVPEIIKEKAKADLNITGRPFVCEVIDALRLPSLSDLANMVHDINEPNDEKLRTAPSDRFYGCNTMGVGIDDNLKFVPASAFKNLQAETESKVKYYECLCWSENEIPTDISQFEKQLGTFPLTIHQATPTRVLHRRSNMIRTRHILTARVGRIDDHHFRLHISTDAGTYVKEFVHGDLGRTKPSISSLCGCKTDILELDCEGIQS